MSLESSTELALYEMASMYGSCAMTGMGLDGQREKQRLRTALSNLNPPSGVLCSFCEEEAAV